MKEILSGQDLYDRLQLVDWNDLLPKLHYYSLNKLERYPALADMYDIPGLSAQIADEAVKLLWEETRKWNINYYPTASEVLKGIIDSLIYNYVNSKTVTSTDAMPEDDRVVYEYGTSPNPEELYIVNETEAEILEILKTDADAAEVFECLRDGLKPREIANELEVDVREIYNIIKRLQRKLKVFTNSKN
ncbi:hypothetical protein AAFN85_18380 [Mucilaginibacter sp. CAU 1740]|uniref:hypothetical protein n=1 Tax=Mucilaginibacter sp. CAU 1740 TaxID=3140365 RepID=UPI00325AA90D